MQWRKFHRNFTGNFTSNFTAGSTGNFTAISRSAAMINFTKQISRMFKKKSHLKISHFICQGPSEVVAAALDSSRSWVTARFRPARPQPRTVTRTYWRSLHILYFSVIQCVLGCMSRLVNSATPRRSSWCELSCSHHPARCVEPCLFLPVSKPCTPVVESTSLVAPCRALETSRNYLRP